FVLICAILLASRRHWFLSLYFAITLATIVVTPWQDQFWRYLAPVAPVTLIFLFLALFAIRRWLKSQHFKSAYTTGAMITTIFPSVLLLVQIEAAAHLFRALSPV